jgi:hypothetical protein
MSKPKQWSEFHGLENMTRTHLDGRPLTAEEESGAEPPPKMQVECVFGRHRSPEVPMAIYLVIDDRRVASRGQKYGQPTWIPMVKEITIDDPPIPIPGNSEARPS